MTVELIGWLAGSSRFRAFAGTYRDKIHKKLRNATDPEAARDVRAELQVARLLLADRRFEVAFEAYGSGKVGPDLTVSFRSTRTFDVEVTRLRHVPDVAGTGAALMAKLRQLTPSTPNVVVLAIDGETATAVDVAAATRALRARADAKDEAFFTARGHRREPRLLRALSATRSCRRLVRGCRRRCPCRRSGRTGRRGSPCRIRRRGRASPACARRDRRVR